MPDKISLDSILSDYHQMAGRVRYSWSAKAAPELSPDGVDKLDCSGFTKYILLRAGMTTDFPDGSIAQREWLKANGYEEKVYSNVLKYARHDGGRLFIAGFDKGDTHRHIFLVLAGHTLESAAGLHGVGSRDAQDFAEDFRPHGSCYELPIYLS